MLMNDQNALFEILDRDTKKVVLVGFKNGTFWGLDTQKYAVINHWDIFLQQELDQRVTTLLAEGRLVFPGPIPGTRYKWLKYLWLTLMPWGRRSSESLRRALLWKILYSQKVSHYLDTAPKVYAAIF